MRLRSRKGPFPPGQYRYREAKTGWVSTLGLTFDETVDEVQAHRLANPRYADKWVTDWNDVANDVEASICKRINYDPNYCIEGDEAKKAPSLPQRPQPASVGRVGAAVVGVKKVMAGIGVLIDWLGNGAKPVPQALAESRAAVCAGCPLNTTGNLTDFFTVPASRMIAQQIEIKGDMKLETTLDAKLGVCSVCLCPMKLKVHTPLEHIKAHLKPESLAALDPRCWITKE